MVTVKTVQHIDAPPSAVWKVVVDPAYTLKLFPDAILQVLDPPGRSALGQKSRVTMKAGKRRVEVLTEIVDIAEGKRVTARGMAGGIYKASERTVVLEPNNGGTDVAIRFSYEISTEYLGNLLNPVAVDGLVRDNLRSYVKNLKELSELLPME